MKTSRRIFSVLLALVMMLGVLGTAMISTAAAENDTITITLTGKDLGINDPISSITNLTFTPSGDATVEVVDIAYKAPFVRDSAYDAFVNVEVYGVTEAELVFELTLKVTGDAGKTADLAIRGTGSAYADGNFTDHDANATLTLAVDAVAAYNAAVEAAAALNERDYTAESWTALETALNAVVGKDIAAATKAITDATAALAKDIDYSALNDAIATAEALKEEDYTSDSWTALQTALTAAKAVAEGAENQAAVNDALKALNTAIASLKAPVVVLPETDTEPAETTPVEEPQWQSPIWPVLFAIFLALTIALTVLIVVYLILKKKKEGDDTPVVDYNIEDDEAELTESTEDEGEELEEADAETAEDEVFADDESDVVADEAADETADEAADEAADETAEEAAEEAVEAVEETAEVAPEAAAEEVPETVEAVEEEPKTDAE